MNATLLGTWPTGSPEWHAARKGKIGGSSIAAVMGLSPYESRFSLWHRMRGDIGAPEINAAMEWGNRLEDAVSQKYADEHPGVYVSRTGLWQNDERPWQVATPDRWLTWPDEDGVLEVKTARYDDDWGQPGTDQIPIHYRCQVLWYLDTLGLDVAHVAVLIGGSDYREYAIVRDAPAADDIHIMRERAEQFLADLAADIRPDIDSHGQTYSTIRELHPDVDARSVDVPDKVGRDVITTKADLAAADARHRLAKNELADHMGSAHYAYWRGVKIADRRCKAAEGSVPYVQLANRLPDPDMEQAS